MNVGWRKKKHKKKSGKEYRGNGATERCTFRRERLKPRRVRRIECAMQTRSTLLLMRRRRRAREFIDNMWYIFIYICILYIIYIYIYIYVYMHVCMYNKGARWIARIFRTSVPSECVPSGEKFLHKLREQRTEWYRARRTSHGSVSASAEACCIFAILYSCDCLLDASYIIPSLCAVYFLLLQWFGKDVRANWEIRQSGDIVQIFSLLVCDSICYKEQENILRRYIFIVYRGKNIYRPILFSDEVRWNLTIRRGCFAR